MSPKTTSAPAPFDATAVTAAEASAALARIVAESRIKMRNQAQARAIERTLASGGR